MGTWKAAAAEPMPPRANSLPLSKWFSTSGDLSMPNTSKVFHYNNEKSGERNASSPAPVCSPRAEGASQQVRHQAALCSPALDNVLYKALASAH